MSASPIPNSTPSDGDLADVLQELRILLQGSQLMTGFLTVLPYSTGFAKIDQAQKWVFVSTFICSIMSLVLFSAPAAHHRLQRPLRDRAKFKRFATRMAIMGMVTLSLSLVLMSQLIIEQILGQYASIFVAAGVAIFVAVVWWIVPIWRRDAVRAPE